MATYLARLRSPFFIDYTSSTTAASADITIKISTVDEYIISKDTNSNRITFEVSELIRDFLDPVWDGVFPYSATTLASLTVEAEVKIEFYTNNKATRAANTAAGTPDSPIGSETITDTLYGFDGYTDFLEGANHQLSSGQLLQSATTMYIPENQSAYIPVESSNGVTYSTVSTSDTSKLVGGITVNIERICEPVYDIVQVIFMNKFGALQEFHFNKKHSISFNSTQESYESMLLQTNTYSTTKHQKYDYNKQGAERLQVNTGYIDVNQYETIKQLMLSELVWAKIDTQVYPVNIKTNSLTKKTKVNDKLVNYTLDMELAYDVVNSVR
tara:strand:+ start:639 stop:1619 length:981 start_codon:yes stop_codon:yes gene_type:complete